MTSVPKISFVSLGCPKALVDSEKIITRLRSEGYKVTNSHHGADAVIVNTCGFLDSAKAESLAAIGTALAENGKVIVTGCLGSQENSIREAFPHILAVSGPNSAECVMDAVHAHIEPPQESFFDLIPAQGIKLTPCHYAYLKISEGCNNRCSFCIIPQLRGNLVSRPIGDVMREAETLVNSGVKELLIISQDTSAYGLDMKYPASIYKDRLVRTKFIDLAKELGSLGIWIRMHYVYPYPHVDEILDLMASKKILPYLDIPFQHASEKILRAMKRPGDQQKLLERIRNWRQICSDVTIRSTFVLGFPGETEEDFTLLLNWLTEAKLDRVGAFKYEPVAGAPANNLGFDPVPHEIQETRYRRFMEHQQWIGARKLKEKVGRHLSVIIDKVAGNQAEGRSKGDSPGIDGKVFVASHRPLRVGEIVSVKIQKSDSYDLFGVTA